MRIVVEPHEDDDGEKDQEEQGNIVKSLVFGGLDGIITTFAIVATVAGARGPPSLVLVMGCANLVADAISMALGDYLSERAEDEFVEAEERRYKARFKSRPVETKRRLAAAYVRAGLAPDQATSLVEHLATRDKVLVAHAMLVHENLCGSCDWKHNHTFKEEEEFCSVAAKKGATTGAAFIAFGATPLIAYYLTVSLVANPSSNIMFTASCLVTTTTLIALGAAKAKLTKQPVIESALGMVVNGGCAALAAFAVGRYLEEHIGGATFAPAEPPPPPPPREMMRPVDISESDPLLSEERPSPLLVLLETTVAALFAAVGAAPTVFMPNFPPRYVALADACAGGAVAAVAVALASDAARDDKLGAACGIILGLGSVLLAKLASTEPTKETTTKDGPKETSPIVAVALASHSLAEGLALGAAYSNSLSRGRTACLSILIHNIPEGLATATVVVGRGQSAAKAVLFALAATAPQPIAAVLAAQFAGLFADLANLFVAFAAAMMLWIALSELIPDALHHAHPSDRDIIPLLAAASGAAVALGVS